MDREGGCWRRCRLLFGGVPTARAASEKCRTRRRLCGPGPSGWRGGSLIRFADAGPGRATLRHRPGRAFGGPRRASQADGPRLWLCPVGRPRGTRRRDRPLAGLGRSREQEASTGRTAPPVPPSKMLPVAYQPGAGSVRGRLTTVSPTTAASDRRSLEAAGCLSQGRFEFAKPGRACHCGGYPR